MKKLLMIFILCICLLLLPACGKYFAAFFGMTGAMGRQCTGWLSETLAQKRYRMYFALRKLQRNQINHNDRSERI